MLLRMPFFAPPLLLQWQIVILESCMLHVAEQFHVYYGPVWQGSGSSKNSFGSGSSDGAAFLVELEPF